MSHAVMRELNCELELLVGQLRSYRQILQKSQENREKSDGLTAEARAQAATRLQDRIAQIEFLEQSPAFQRITCTFDDAEQQTIWIAKFAYLPANIFSWAAPIGKLRFCGCGRFSIDTPAGQRTGTIHSKLIFQIVNNHILFLSSQTTDGTELIHQEHFANHEFSLKEVVSRLESYQDEIISTDYRTPLQITGPAGSGKTTLGFHRLAYLHQNSGVSQVFDTTSSLALINDESTRDYFMSILRPLNMGHQVQVMTPTQWMTSLLQVPKDIRIVNDYATNDIDMLWYYYEKSRVNLPNHPFDQRKYFDYLDAAYLQLPNTLQTRWAQQKRKKLLDRYDLAILIRAHHQHNGAVLYNRPVTVQTRKFGAVTQYFPEALRYASILTDEFQNYTHHEHQLIQSCIHPETNTLMFVGDPNQQTLPGTKIYTPANTKHIHIDKTYRNSAAILQHLGSLGYDVPATSGSLQTGLVTEHTIAKSHLLEQTIGITLETRRNSPSDSIGIIVFDESIATHLQVQIPADANIFIGTAYGVQGVEFEHAIVILPTDGNPSQKDADRIYPSDFLAEYSTIMRDRIYVALTRAITTLTMLHTG